MVEQSGNSDTSTTADMVPQSMRAVNDRFYAEQGGSGWRFLAGICGDYARKTVPSLDKDTHAFQRCKSALTASSNLEIRKYSCGSLPCHHLISPR